MRISLKNILANLLYAKNIIFSSNKAILLIFIRLYNNVPYISKQLTFKL